MKLAWDSKVKQMQSDGRYVRVRSADPYHSARWTKLSKMWRAQHPLCEECKKRGVIRPAEVTDHIIPYPVCGDFFDTGNLQSLCEECNHRKGQADKAVIAAWKRAHPSHKG